MTFAQRRNRVTTHFSERIPVVRRRISVVWLAGQNLQRDVKIIEGKGLYPWDIRRSRRAPQMLGHRLHSVDESQQQSVALRSAQTQHNTVFYYYFSTTLCGSPFARHQIADIQGVPGGMCQTSGRCSLC